MGRADLIAQYAPGGEVSGNRGLQVYDVGAHHAIDMSKGAEFSGSASRFLHEECRKYSREAEVESAGCVI